MDWLRFDDSKSQSAAIQQAAAALRDGGIVAYPTDTFYGLAVDPRRADAVRRLFALKGRAETSALTLIAADIAQARRAAECGTTAAALVAEFWPGPLTIVAAAEPGLAPETLAGGTTVGVRVPANDIARALAAAFGFCITATSANRSGERPLANPAEVASQLRELDVLLDAGRAPGGAPSTIVAVDGTRVTLVRAGAIAWERVLKSLPSA